MVAVASPTGMLIMPPAGKLQVDVMEDVFDAMERGDIYVPASPTSVLQTTVTSKLLSPSIITAAAGGNVATLRRWMNGGSCVIDAESATDGRTALHVAAASGQHDVIHALLKGGASVLAVDADRRTALHLAAQLGHGGCVKALCDAGSDVAATDEEGNTPLALAEQGKHLGTTRLLRMRM